MFNQVILVGCVAEIYATKIDIDVDGEIIPVEMSENMISQLLLNNQIGIKGYIKMSNNGIPNIICNKLTILDRRGKKNGN